MTDPRLDTQAARNAREDAAVPPSGSSPVQRWGVAWLNIYATSHYEGDFTTPTLAGAEVYVDSDEYVLSDLAVAHDDGVEILKDGLYYLSFYVSNESYPDGVTPDATDRLQAWVQSKLGTNAPAYLVEMSALLDNSSDGTNALRPIKAGTRLYLNAYAYTADVFEFDFSWSIEIHPVLLF